VAPSVGYLQAFLQLLVELGPSAFPVLVRLSRAGSEEAWLIHSTNEPPLALPTVEALPLLQRALLGARAETPAPTPCWNSVFAYRATTTPTQAGVESPGAHGLALSLAYGDSLEVEWAGGDQLQSRDWPALYIARLAELNGMTA